MNLPVGSAHQLIVNAHLHPAQSTDDDARRGEGYHGEVRAQVLTQGWNLVFKVIHALQQAGDQRVHLCPGGDFFQHGFELAPGGEKRLSDI